MFKFFRKNIILCIIINAILLSVVYEFLKNYESKHVTKEEPKSTELTIEHDNEVETSDVKASDRLELMWKSLNDINPTHVKPDEVVNAEKFGIDNEDYVRSIDNLDQNTLNELLNSQTNGLPNSFVTEEIENIQSIQNGKGGTVHMSTQFANYTFL